MLYLRQSNTTLALKLFRGEPAISGFDWNFSASHIRRLFNGGRFGPPWSFTSTSAWTWLGHPVSGLWHTTSRPCQTRSRFGFRPQVLNHAAYHNSPDHSTKGTISHFDVLYVLVSTEFQVLFTPLPGFFSPFLHSTLRYRSLGSI